METILKTDCLTKCYGQFRAVDNVSININKGDIYGLVGRNGAGKTTLIRLLTGLIIKTFGSFELYGIPDSQNINSVKNKMGAVVETPSLYYGMTAYENLKEQYLVLGLNDENAIYELLILVGLDNVGEKKVANFSLGMKQRLGIAMALLSKPEFLILDEPTNGLDPQGIIEIRELLLKLNKEFNLTILISSHILSELSKLATCYGFIEQGRLLKEISAEEIKLQCKNSTRIMVNSTEKAAGILENELNIKNYKIWSDTLIEFFDTFDIGELSIAFKKENISIVNIVKTEEDLESYYINLVGGAK
jgi:ABC-2 type transport system ATP-binding protein